MNETKKSIQVYGENEGSIFSTSSSETIYPKTNVALVLSRPLITGKEPSNRRIQSEKRTLHMIGDSSDEDSSEISTISSIQSGTFHVIRFFFCILQMLVILSTIMVTVVGIRYVMIYVDIVKCQEHGREDHEPHDVGRDDESDDYHGEKCKAMKRVSHVHSDAYLLNLRISIVVLFLIVLTGIPQQIFGWFSLIKLTKRMMYLCLVTDVIITTFVFAFNSFRIDSSKVIVVSISLLTIIDSLLLLFMVSLMKTQERPLIQRLESRENKRKRLLERRKSWIMNRWS
jgi:hypothetical protein